jgi:hypothetical protein
VTADWNAYIRAGSGLVIMASGALLAIRSRHHWLGPAFGVAVGAWGAYFVAFNLAGPTPFLVPALALACVGLTATVAALPTSVGGFYEGAKPPRSRVVVSAVIVTLCVTAMILRGASENAKDWAYPVESSDAVAFWIESTIFMATLGALLAFCALLSASPRFQKADAWGVALIAVGISADVALRSGEAVSLFATQGVSVWFLYLAVLLAAGSWSVPLARPGGGRQARAALMALFALLGLPLLGAVDGTILASYATPTYGVVRLVGAVLVVWGAARLGALPSDRGSKTRAGSVVAFLGLALLFVVAQVAQNFFAAQYGLLLGGVIAGCFLFAAQPVQRMIERRGERRVGVEPASSQSELVFKAAVRTAISEGPITPAQERHLSEVAHHLGIGAMDMIRLKQEVETEGASVRVKEADS